MERLLGLLIGLAILGLLVAVPVILFGGGLLAAVAAIAAFPVAFPLTTLAIVAFLGVVALVTYRKRRRRRGARSPGVPPR